MKVKRSLLQEMINEEVSFYRQINEEYLSLLQEAVYLNGNQGRYLVYFFNGDCPQGRGGEEVVKRYSPQYGKETIPLKMGKLAGSADIIGSVDQMEEFHKMVIEREQEIIKRYGLEDSSNLGDFVYDTFMIIDKETGDLVDPPQGVPFDAAVRGSNAKCDGPFGPGKTPNPNAIKARGSLKKIPAKSTEINHGDYFPGKGPSVGEFGKEEDTIETGVSSKTKK